MSILALLNLILYAYVVVCAFRYFHTPRAHRRDADKVVVASVGMLSVLFALAQGWMLISEPYVGGVLKSKMVILYLFCLSNGVLYLSIVEALGRAPRESHTCQTSKRYFP